MLSSMTVVCLIGWQLESQFLDGTVHNNFSIINIHNLNKSVWSRISFYYSSYGKPMLSQGRLYHYNQVSNLKVGYWSVPLMSYMNLVEVFFDPALLQLCCQSLDRIPTSGSRKILFDRFATLGCIEWSSNKKWP